MDMQAKETSSEDSGMWLPLVEYSIKTGVSLSTIRRKIKNNSLCHRLEKGKYFILFGELPKPPEKAFSAPPPQVIKQEEETSSYDYLLKEKEDRIRFLEKKNKELEEKLDELRILIQVIEDKYDVHY